MSLATAAVVVGLFDGLFPAGVAVAQSPVKPKATLELPAELREFTRQGSASIFTAAPAGAWDAKLRERGWIVREGEQWRMWYTGYDGSATGRRMLGYATSLDGIAWTRHRDNPIYREHWVEDMMIVKQNGIYHMFAEGEGDQSQLLTSPDGLAWTRVRTLDIRMKNGEPISPGPFGTPTAWFENGMWYLFYERGDQAVWLATSKDLKVFTHVQDEPVIAKGPGDYDQVMLALNQVEKIGNVYVAVLHGTSTPAKPRLWSTSFAVSTDLVHWTKWTGNPLLPAADDKSSGQLVHDGKRWRLYTHHDHVDWHLAPSR